MIKIAGSVLDDDKVKKVVYSKTGDSRGSLELEYKDDIDICDLTFEPLGDMNMTAPRQVGGIEVGTKMMEVAGMKINDLLQRILFPILGPRVTSQPSLTLSLLQNKVFEIGDNLPDMSKFTYTFNRGSVAYNSSYVGPMAPGSEKLYLGDNLFQPAKIINRTYSYKLTIDYQANNTTFVDSAGNVDTSFVSPPAGTITSNIVTINCNYPLYSNCYSLLTGTPNVDMLKGLPDINNNSKKLEPTLATEIILMFGPEKQDKPILFVPKDKIEVTQVQAYNSVSGKFENVSQEFDGISNSSNATTTFNTLAGNTIFKLVNRKTSSVRSGATFYKFILRNL